MAIGSLGSLWEKGLNVANNAVKRGQEKLAEFMKKNIGTRIEDTRKNTNEVLMKPMERQQNQKNENLNLLFDAKIPNKNIQVINKKTGTVREFSGYSTSGKLILLNTKTGQKEIASRELLDGDAYEIKNSPVVMTTRKIEKTESEIKVLQIIKELNKDRFVKHDVLRLLREKFEGTYRSPQVAPEIRDKSKRIVEQLLKSRTSDLPSLVYKQLLEERTLPEEPLFGVEADQEIIWPEDYEGTLFGENNGNQKVEWLEKKDQKVVKLKTKNSERENLGRAA